MITYGSTTLANIRDGEDGTSVTITSTSIKYQKGTSGTTKPTGTWQTSIPSIGENEFLWTQTIVNYSDGSKTEAYSVSRNAKNGTSPTVSSTTVEYQQSTGGTTPPTGTWSSTAPTAIAGQYIWTKITITYSDGKTAVSYSVSKNGTNGVSVTNVTSTNNTADGGTSVVTITLSDGTTKTFNVKNGTKGTTGATAQWYYGTALTHTSGTATLVATSTSGAVVGSMYLNTQTSLVYKCTAVGTNNTWTYAGDLTTGVINNIEIGGRNLFGIGSDCATSLTGLIAQNFSIVTEDGYKCAHATGALGTTAHLTSKIPFTPKPLEKMVFSADIKIKNIVLGTTNPMCEFYFSGQTINGTWRSQKVSSTYVDGELVATGNSKFHLILPSNEWHRVTVKWQFTDAEFTANMPPAIYLRDCTGEIFVKNIKYERGTQETDWTPAPEDMQADIDTALAQSIWYATCSDAGATKSATITPVTTNFELNVGTTVNVKFTNTNNGARASLTLNVNNTGAKNIKYINGAKIEDIPGNGYILGGRTYLFVYDGTYWVIQNLNYNTNETNHILNNFSGKTGELGIWQTGLFMKDGVGTYQNICTNNAGAVTRTAEYNKKANTKGFEIGSSIYFSPSNTYGANANITGAVYASYGAFDSRYSLNAEGANALTAYMPIYLTGTINNIDELFHLDTIWWTQTPTDPDKVYVLIGGCYDYYHASSTDYWRITLYEQNNWYKYVNGTLVDYSNNLAELAATTATAFIAVDTDNNGIMVHPEDDMSSGWQIGTAINLVKGGLNYLKLWFDNLTAKIRIGNEEENHLLIDNEGLYFNGIENNEIKELAAFKSTGISFNNETPYKIGNDDTYIRFEDTNNDGKADKLSIVADSISFADSNETVQAQLENLQNGFDSIQNNNYIKIIPSEPSITIAADSNESISSLKLTSDKLSFMVQDNEIAYMANDQMDIPTASVTNLFMQSADNTYEKLWVMRSNGHLSLKTVKKD